jgi:hypothetical protein
MVEIISMEDKYEETIRVDERFVGCGRYGNVTWSRVH